MKKYWIIIALLVGVIIFQYFYFKPQKQVTSDPTEFIEKIDSLESEIANLSNVRDSISCRIDTVYQKLDNNTKEYEKDFNTIISNDADEDLRFFLGYINDNKHRLDSLRNSSGH